MAQNFNSNPQVVDGVCVGIEEAPQTLTGVPLNLDQIRHAALPHATRAVSAERPNGGDTRVNNRTVLQQHVDFFDQDKDDPTHESWIPDPRLPIITKNIHRCHHGSDSIVYDKEGRFMPGKFEELFAKYDKENKGGLSLRDMLQLWNHNRDAYDLFGWSADFLEWLALYLAAVDEKGIVSKESVRGQYDGTLFYQLARKQDAKKAAQRKDIKDKRT
ncbi:g10973 [Coccomyxa elongata]